MYKAVGGGGGPLFRCVNIQMSAARGRPQLPCECVTLANIFKQNQMSTKFKFVLFKIKTSIIKQHNLQL